MGKLLKSIIFSCTLAAMALSVLPVAAQFEPIDNCGTLGIPCGGAGDNVSTLAGKITDVINLVLGLVGVVAVGAIIYGGVKYIFSHGDEYNAEAGKKVILYAVIGLIVIIAAAAIVNFVAEGIFTPDNANP
jgi:hypothetical protein